MVTNQRPRHDHVSTFAWLPPRTTGMIPCRLLRQHVIDPLGESLNPYRYATPKHDGLQRSSVVYRIKDYLGVRGSTQPDSCCVTAIGNANVVVIDFYLRVR